jgi:rhodanese-related sulfurtransferase
VGLIAIGVIQLRRATVCSTGRKRWSAIVLAVSAGIVVAVIFFPQVLAGLMADWVMLGR